MERADIYVQKKLLTFFSNKKYLHFCLTKNYSHLGPKIVSNNHFSNKFVPLCHVGYFINGDE